MRIEPKNLYELPIEFILIAGLLTALLSLCNTVIFRLSSSSVFLTDGISDLLVYSTIICILTTCFLLVIIMRRRMLMDIESYHEKLALSRMYEERFRLTIDNAPIGTATISLDGSILSANQALSEMLGYSPQELLSRKLTEIEVPKETVSDDELLLEQLMNNRIQKYRISKEYVRKDGSIIETVQSMSMLRDANDNPVHLIAQIEDVTERNRTRRALDAERELLATTLESIQEGVVSVDAHRTILLVNDAAKDLLDTDKEELVGKRLDRILSALDEKTQELCKTTFDSVLLENSTEHFLVEIKASLKEDKPARIIEGCAAPTHDKYGSAVGAVVVFRDITEQVRAEEQIRYLSFHDKLTGLYNRAYFEGELHKVDTDNRLPISLIMGDVNGLKLVNDAFGHEKGDELLKAIAEIIQSSCREKDVAARWGGDEFAIILPQTPGQIAEQICTEIRDACRNAGEGPIQPSIALGCMTKEKPGQDIRQILRDAEDKMYNKKLVESRSARSSIISSLRRTLAERTYNTEEHSVRLQNLALAFDEHWDFPTPILTNLSLAYCMISVGSYS